MEKKIVFLDKRVYWLVVIILLFTLIAHVLLLNRKFSFVILLHVLWMCAVLFLVFTKNKAALFNVKAWLVVAFVASPLIRMAGRFLNEMLDGFGEFQVEFYLYRILSVLVGLIVFNWVRNTVRVENS